MWVFAVLLISLFVFLAIGTPIGISMGASCILTMIATGSTNTFPVIAQKMFTAVDSFPFMAIPLFILAGNLMQAGGISHRIVKFMKLLLKRLPAATACITTVAATFFGAISGSAPATAAAIGGVTINPMKASGYKPEEAAAINACSGTLGIIIPPSIPMITFATTAGVSIGTVFMGGVVPGILCCTVLCIMHIIRFGKVEKRSTERVPFTEALAITVDALWALGMPVIILGGIYGGVFTPTEAAAVACVYSIFVSCFCYKTLNFKKLLELFRDTGVRCGVTMITISIATPFAWFLTSSGLTGLLSSTLLSTFTSRFALLLIINLVLFFLGCFMEPQSIIMLMTPIILPITNAFGISPIAVGVFIVVNIAVGMMTPPMAGCIYVSNQMAGLKSIGPMVGKIWPYIVAMALITLLITYVPEISLILPRALGMNV